MFSKIKKTFQWGGRTVHIETGEIARQATSSVLVNIDDTVILATVVGLKETKPNQNFLPLTVDYIEKSYAAGKIPGGFFRREGRPSENEILISRLIDRPLRPLFPKDFYHEIQIIVHVLSVNPEIQPDIPAMIGASAALSISGIPFYGPVSAARIGYENEQYLLNPIRSKQSNGQLDLIVAGTQKAVLMVEANSKQLSEEKILEAITFGHKQLQVVIDVIHELKNEAGKPKWEWQSPLRNELLEQKVTALIEEDLCQIYQISSKQERSLRIKKAIDSIVLQLSTADDIENVNINEIERIIFELQSKIVRSNLLNGESRIDGRDTRTVREIAIRTGVLPRVHGSALFTRGETQSLVTVTLGVTRDEQIIDALEGEQRDRFMFHYNMLPFSTGEIGRVGIPKRREIGHGRLAKRALIPILPTSEEFAYSLRIVSEITESNGSSSMASVCGGCLALMDAGVPIKAHVAGVAMGLILDGNKFTILTDILGDEDYLGDMDFKVAGTIHGITALQMDIKIQGITKEIMKIALEQAKEARFFILNEMQKEMSQVRSALSIHAPLIKVIKIQPDKIREVIGKGGSTIQAITRETNTNIDIAEDGTITISSVSSQDIESAKKRIEIITAELEIGKIYEGPVVKILEFGVLVNILPGKDGLLHISEIAHERVKDIANYLKEGQIIRVKLLSADDRGRLKLSLKAISDSKKTST